MNKNDFCFMIRGKQLAYLTNEEISLLEPINKKGKKHGHALILVHGFSSSVAVYRNLIPQLTSYDAIICPNLPGHAASIEELSQVKATDWLEYLHALCEEAFAQYTKVDIVGLSLGGLLACKLSEHFAFNRIFLLAPALKLHMNEPRYVQLCDVLLRLGFKEIRGAAGNLVSDAHAELSYRRLPISTVREMFQFVVQHQWVAPTMSVELFLGAHDKVVDSKAVEALFQPLQQVTVHWLENSAHVLPLDNDLSQIVACINQSQ